MSQEDISHCTEFLWQGKEASRVQSSGFGIGLWVTNAVVEAHGGQVRVTSVDNLTTFELVFGLVRAGGNHS